MRTRTLIAALSLAILTSAAPAFAQSEAEMTAWFTAYDAAFNAKDLEKLATMYHPDVTIFEGAIINRGWVDYRDNHLGPELRMFQDLAWAHTNIQVHPLGPSAAYVTADYSIKYKAADRAVDSGGIATHVLVREGGVWKIRHTMTATRRRPPA